MTVEGAYVRAADAFRTPITADGRTGLPAAAGRYHLYVSHSCPWAHRTVIVRALLGLEDAISLSAVDPVKSGKLWIFRDGPGHSADPISGFANLAEAYHASDPAYGGRATVPALWDRVGGRIVNNADDDLMRSFETEFGAFARTPADLYPLEHRAEIERWNAAVNDALNDGVYRAHHARSDAARKQAYDGVYAMLATLDERLATRRYLIAARPVETDWRIFVTLVRFDAAYVAYALGDGPRLAAFPHVDGYLRDLAQIPGIAATVNFDHIQRHYLDRVAPERVPDLTAPHGRADLP